MRYQFGECNIDIAFRLAGPKKKKKKKPKKKLVVQSDPPRIPLSKLFPDGEYPEGELQDYKDEYVIKSIPEPSASHAARL